jgi:hypothetical protein
MQEGEMPDNHLSNGSEKCKRAVSAWTIVGVASLVIVILAGSWIANLYLRHQDQMSAIRVIERHGGNFSYSSDAPQWLVDLQPFDPWPGTPAPWVPKWIRQCLPATALCNWMIVIEHAELGEHGPRQMLVSNLSGESVMLHGSNGELSDDEARIDIALTREELPLLAKFPRLTSLSLRRTAVEDADLAMLQKLRSLKRLCLNWTNISDSGIDTLADIESLTALMIAGTEISDAGLMKLTKHKNLQYLDVRGTNVTEAGLKPFRDRPYFELVLDDPELSLIMY